MELIRYDPEKAQPLPDSVGTFFVPVKSGERMTAMLLVLDKKGDTGKRELPNDVMISVVAGEGHLRAGNEYADVQPGDVFIVPAGSRHQLWTAKSQLQVIMVTL
jgi:quercetin dioxygenase-like cupin family protein